MTNSTNSKLANNSNCFDYGKQTNSDNGWIFGCIAMIVVYGLIIYGLVRLWSGVSVSSVFDGTWQPTYP